MDFIADNEDKNIISLEQDGSDVNINLRKVIVAYFTTENGEKQLIIFKDSLKENNITLILEP